MENQIETLSLRDLGRWYWGLYDDMEYPAAGSAEHLTDAQIFQILHQQFTSSDCGDFAIALNELTGWPMVNILSLTIGGIHGAAVHPNGKLVDYEGFVTLGALKSRYGTRDLKVVAADISNVIGKSDLYLDDLLEDEISGVELAQAAIRFLDYPPFDSICCSVARAA